ncbi:sterol O-acyltransferase 1-like [Arctopsyche grandis]|uniref:sterol O-acyltransferase 1-like n=1 Tax=Arctopsyche grandis TaxID=121162 RepID=UPI00406D8B09
MEENHNNLKMKDFEEKFKNLINTNFKRELEENIRTVSDKVLKEILQQNSDIQNNNSIKNGLPEKKSDQPTKKILSDKVFVARDSLLTDLLNITHIKTIYNIFVVILILLFLNTTIYDLISSGSINMGFRLITIGFGKISTAMTIWTCMQFVALLPFPLLKKWANTRKTLLNKPGLLKIWDISCLCFHVLFQMFFLCLPIRAVIINGLPIASALIVLIETVRMLMKIHAFIRTASPRALDITQSKNIPLPEFSSYLYFLFAPTLIYRDSYPRTNHIRWNKVVTMLFEVAAIIFYINFLSERFLVHNFGTFGQTSEVELKQLVLALFGSMLPALLTYLCCFYLLLHCWHNAFAEILTFGDRRFYLDWWNQTGYGGFYRTWNMIVHDWLYTYIYKDIFRLSGNRMLATFCVFLTSALFHEIIVTFALGFFYPVLLVLFGMFGVLLIFITKHANPTTGNIVMWLTLAIGNGILWLAYGLEFFARKNCPQTIESNAYDLIIPRSWFCQRIILTPDWEFQNPFSDSSVS